MGMFEFVKDLKKTGKPVLLPQGDSAVIAHDYNERGLSLHNQGRFKEAIQQFDIALDARPQHAIAWFNKGVSLARIGNSKEAIGCFDKALEIDPNYIDAMFSKGTCAFELNQYVLALDCFEKVIALNPNDIQAQQCRLGVLKTLAEKKVE